MINTIYFKKKINPQELQSMTVKINYKNISFKKISHNLVLFTDDKFSLSPEQAAVFARENEPTCIQGLMQGVVGQFVKEDVAIDVFKTGRGRPWGEHHE